ncbi:MAG TPA: carbohydrate kinase family protein [Anaerolineaceae bacterium]|nr:carbohydrate kinase family protein [Anaerolineaceae bacterium]
MALWEGGIGLIARVGEDYPRDWLRQIKQRNFDTRGIHILPESIDVRDFYAYPQLDNCQNSQLVGHFARVGLPFPKTLLGYAPPAGGLDHRTQPSATTLRANDFPSDYLDATAAHLCPLDFLSHTLLPPLLHRGHVTSVTIDPAAGYMNPAFWDDMPKLFKGITAILVSERKAAALFEGRSSDPWEMVQGLASFGCPLVVLKRGAAGQYLYDAEHNERWVIPAYPSRVSDPTGAGDAFCGGFLAGWRLTYDPLIATLYGNISASLVVEGSGPFYALDSLPGLAEARLESLKDLPRKI